MQQQDFDEDDMPLAYLIRLNENMNIMTLMKMTYLIAHLNANISSKTLKMYYPLVFQAGGFLDFRFIGDLGN